MIQQFLGYTCSKQLHRDYLTKEFLIPFTVPNTFHMSPILTASLTAWTMSNKPQLIALYFFFYSVLWHFFISHIILWFLYLLHFFHLLLFHLVSVTEKSYFSLMPSFLTFPMILTTPRCWVNDQWQSNRRHSYKLIFTFYLHLMLLVHSWLKKAWVLMKLHTTR